MNNTKVVKCWVFFSFPKSVVKAWKIKIIALDVTTALNLSDLRHLACLV
jgi:hypothetical protein